MRDALVSRWRSWRSWRHGSIRGQLLRWLLPGIVVLLLVDGWNDYIMLHDAAAAAHDAALSRQLLNLAAELQDAPGAVELGSLSRKGWLDFSVRAMPGSAGHPGALLAGTDRIPLPMIMPGMGHPIRFYDAVSGGDRVRVATMLGHDSSQAGSRNVLLMVGESEVTGRRIEREVLQRALARDAGLVVVVVLLVLFCASQALRPLERVRDQVSRREPDDLSALDVSDVPAEVLPLVETVNRHIDRYRKIRDEQVQFLEDASHQLRTPLAIISTQTDFALRTHDAAQREESLRAISQQLGHARRLSAQLLSLAHADRQERGRAQRVDPVTLAREAVFRHLPLARKRGQDLGWQAPALTPGTSVPAVYVDEAEILEALSNLIHNAIHYTHPDGRITVTLRTDTAVGLVGIEVIDNGPGIEPQDRVRVFTRFERLPGTRMSGSGLGLAIAMAYAKRNGGSIGLGNGDPNPAGGVGLAATIWLPSV